MINKSKKIISNKIDTKFFIFIILVPPLQEGQHKPLRQIQFGIIYTIISFVKSIILKICKYFSYRSLIFP